MAATHRPVDPTCLHFLQPGSSECAPTAAAAAPPRSLRHATGRVPARSVSARWRVLRACVRRGGERAPAPFPPTRLRALRLRLRLGLRLRLRLQRQARRGRWAPREPRAARRGAFFFLRRTHARGPGVRHAAGSAWRRAALEADKTARWHTRLVPPASASASERARAAWGRPCCCGATRRCLGRPAAGRSALGGGAGVGVGLRRAQCLERGTRSAVALLRARCVRWQRRRRARRRWVLGGARRAPRGGRRRGSGRVAGAGGGAGRPRGRRGACLESRCSRRTTRARTTTACQTRC